MLNFVSDTAIEKLWSRSLEQFTDNRGRFVEIFRNRTSLMSIPDMVQDSLSESVRGVVRGMHIQVGQWQLVTVLQGEILDIVIDLNTNSSSFLTMKSNLLSSNGLNQLLIGPGIALLSSESILIHRSFQISFLGTIFLFRIETPYSQSYHKWLQTPIFLI